MHNEFALYVLYIHIYDSLKKKHELSPERDYIILIAF
jgi:hypothetical protein